MTKYELYWFAAMKSYILYHLNIFVLIKEKSRQTLKKKKNSKT